MLKRMTYSSLFLLMLLFSCAQASEQIKDPLVSGNRMIYKMNVHLDKNILRPVTIFYSNYTPLFVQNRIQNFLSYAGEPVNFINSFMQFRIKEGVHSVARFWVNSIFGVFGLYDVASKLGVPLVDKNSFRKTLYVWGVDKDIFVMLPFVGPNLALNSMTSFTLDSMQTIFSREGVFILLSGISQRQALISQESLWNSSSDPYRLIRDAYVQNRVYSYGTNEFSSVSNDAMESDDAFFDDDFF